MKPAVKQSLLGGAMLLAVWLAGLCERQMVNTQFMLRLSKISGGELLLPVFLSLVSGTTVGLLAWLGQEKKTAPARWPALAFALAQPVASMGFFLNPSFGDVALWLNTWLYSPTGMRLFAFLAGAFLINGLLPSASSPKYL